ncbi:hypothetical protein SERLA73DRAFT_70078 [Serpula lacrymans var. lacrymans S7.3]|uniref:Histidine kinase/HSP90-like ATPase domain-containing protein n=1 Tax=Serpula lacrymans var. lacrymans (strain S7.3) TaxID=936435 RepID=F8PLT6_SERL3|nr:hypothetical protein SERLA73DRAFT_70078 [Serpula lacrymans var. lacrymans S7.3]
MLVVCASQNNPDLMYGVDPDIPGKLIDDSLQLQQVVTDLVVNTIKSSLSKVTHKGLVTQSTELLALYDQSVTLELCVTGAAIGVAKDKLNPIIDTFCQVGDSTTREYGGMGLGLSLSK